MPPPNPPLTADVEALLGTAVESPFAGYTEQPVCTPEARVTAQVDEDITVAERVDRRERGRWPPPALSGRRKRADCDDFGVAGAAPALHPHGNVSRCRRDASAGHRLAGSPKRNRQAADQRLSGGCGEVRLAGHRDPVLDRCPRFGDRRSGCGSSSRRPDRKEFQRRPDQLPPDRGQCRHCRSAQAGAAVAVGCPPAPVADNTCG